MTGILIQHMASGERQVVADLEGYDEAAWEVLAIDREPLPNEVWSGSGWVVDQALAAAQDEIAEITDRERLRQIIRSARQRLLTLEDEVTTLRSAGVTLRNRVNDLEARILALETA